MIDYALGFGTCLLVAILWPNVFQFVKDKAIALYKRMRGQD